MTTEAEVWVPAFEGQRPPFKPGNQVGLRHGAYSPKRVNPLAQEFVDEVLTDPQTAYLRLPEFTAALWSWGVAAARVSLITDWVDALPFVDAANSRKGQVSPLELLRQWNSTLQTLGSRLGLDPMSAARLGLDYAQGNLADAATILSHLRAAQEHSEVSDE